MSHFRGFFCVKYVQSYDLLNVKTVYVFSRFNILNEITEVLLRLDLIACKRKV